MRKIQDFIEYWKFSDEDRGDDYWNDTGPKEFRRTDSTIL